jgi:hypothetical protein
MTTSPARARFGATQLVIVALCSAIYAVLGIAGASFSVAPGGIVIFYLPAIFIYAAAIWFGAWGVLGAFFGTLLFSPFFGYGFALGLSFAVVDMVSPAIVGLAQRGLKLDPTVTASRRAFVTFAVIVIVAAAVEAVLGNVVLLVFALTSFGGLAFSTLVWWTGEISAGILLTPILLRVLTPQFKRMGLFHQQFFGSQRGARIVS